MWRFNSVFGSASSQQRQDDTDIDKIKSINFSLSVGREFRKVLFENLEGRVGFDVSLSYQSNKNEQDNPAYITTYEALSPGANAVLGMNYIIKQKVILGAELLPGLYYTAGESTEESNGETNTTGINNFGFSLSNMARLSIAYRF